MKVAGYELILFDICEMWGNKRLCNNLLSCVVNEMESRHVIKTMIIVVMKYLCIQKFVATLKIVI